MGGASEVATVTSVGSTKPVIDMGLTPKREAFCLAYLRLGNASEAYRQSYSAGNMADRTIWEKASRLLADGKVKARVEDRKNRRQPFDTLPTERLLEIEAELAADRTLN
jgi:phage terminase small subunit